MPRIERCKEFYNDRQVVGILSDFLSFLDYYGFLKCSKFLVEDDFMVDKFWKDYNEVK